jgi:hypothetical protein
VELKKSPGTVLILLSFIFSCIIPPQGFSQIVLAPPVQSNPVYFPLNIHGISIHQDDPLLFDFIIDTGRSDLVPGKDDEGIKAESLRLIKYFFASLTAPEKEQWVNLSPVEKNRIVPEALGKTDLGRDMLVEDYRLKQVVVSMIDPQSETGKEFWSRVYARVEKEYWTTSIPLDVLNRVWIVTDKAAVYSQNDQKGKLTAVVTQAHLKVMLEQDYTALHCADTEPSFAAPAPCPRDGYFGKAAAVQNEITQNILRDILLPELENEVNAGRNFSVLRQIHQAVVQATWYKRNLRQALLTQVYAGRNKMDGLQRAGKGLEPREIYTKYLRLYKDGVFNFIREDQDSLTGELVPRKYFSGGVVPVPEHVHASGVSEVTVSGDLVAVRVRAIDPAQKNDGDPVWKQKMMTLVVLIAMAVQGVDGRSSLDLRAVSGIPVVQNVQPGTEREMEVSDEVLRRSVPVGRNGRLTVKAKIEDVSDVQITLAVQKRKNIPEIANLEAQLRTVTVPGTGVITRLLPAEIEPGGVYSEKVVVLGPNAKALMAQLQMATLKYKGNVPSDSPEFRLAVILTQGILAMQAPNGGFYVTPVETPNAYQHGSAKGDVSNYHTLLAYQALKMFVAVSRENQYGKEFRKTIAVALDMTENYFQSRTVFDRDSYLFYPGGYYGNYEFKDDKYLGDSDTFNPRREYASDVALNMINILGVERVDGMYGRKTAYNIFERVIQLAGQYPEVNAPEEGDFQHVDTTLKGIGLLAGHSNSHVITVVAALKALDQMIPFYPDHRLELQRYRQSLATGLKVLKTVLPDGSVMMRQGSLLQKTWWGEELSNDPCVGATAAFILYSAGKDPGVLPHFSDRAGVLSQKVLTSDLLGGIDFNIPEFPVTTGQPVDIMFDPVMLERFRQGDFYGILPVIINMVPLGPKYAAAG